MNERLVPSMARPQARRLLFAAVSLSFLLVVSAMPAAAGPGQPTSSTGAGVPGGGDPGGDDPGGDGPNRKVALGMATPDGRSLAEVDAFTASVGGIKPAIWAIWSAWGNASRRDFPATMAHGLRGRGIMPMIWWEPVSPGDLSDPTYPRHKNISNGNHDAYIRQWARDAAAYDGKVLLRFAHEANSNYFPWSINSFDNSPATFKAAWRHVHDIFQEEGATKVKFLWSVAKKACANGCNPYTEVYPGDTYVDVMGFSGYNWGNHPGKTWKSMFTSFNYVTQKLKEVSDKPIIAAETASNSIGGDKPQWIRDGYREVYDRIPEIKAIVYLNADLRNVGHPDWRITTPSGALTAYAEIAALPEFSARWPFSAGAKTNKKARAGKKQSAADRKHKSVKTSTKKPPRVQKGAEVGGGNGSSSGAIKTKAQKTKKKPKKKSQPPAVLDSFGR